MTYHNHNSNKKWKKLKIGKIEFEINNIKTESNNIGRW